jgi:hypothetical protein
MVTRSSGSTLSRSLTAYLLNVGVLILCEGTASAQPGTVNTSPPFQMSSERARYARAPVVTGVGSGFVVVWPETAIINQPGIIGQRFALLGERVGDDFEVTTPAIARTNKDSVLPVLERRWVVRLPVSLHSTLLTPFTPT